MSITLSMRHLVVAFALLLWNISSVFSQDIYNKGQAIFIGPDAIVSFPGSYTDDPDVISPLNDPSLFISGTLYVKGNLTNASERGNLIKTDPGAVGKVIMTGTNPVISGIDSCYFPNLELRVIGALTLNQSIIIHKNLTLTSGSINLGNTNKSILLGWDSVSTIVGESATRQIYGSSGSVVTTDITLDQTENAPNFGGIGFGFRMGIHNFDAVITRVHDNGNQPGLTDGVRTFRLYKVVTPLVDPDDNLAIDEIFVKYNDATLGSYLELNGISETNLALYVSNDNGATWLKIGTQNTGTNEFRATNVRINDNNAVNLFAISVEDCIANRPDADLEAINETPDVIGSDLDICEAERFEIQFEDIIPGYYYRLNAHPRSHVVEATSYLINSISDEDQGAYTSFVRTPRGCDDTDIINVEVRDKPVAAFEITDSGDNDAECLRDVLTFVDDSSTDDDQPGHIREWYWEFDDEAITDRTVVNTAFENPQFAYTDLGDAGDNYPSLVVTTNHNCVSDTVKVNVIIETLPVPAFTMLDITEDTVDNICEDIDIYFKNWSRYRSHNGDSSDLIFLWDFDDSNSSDLQHPKHAIQTHGTFDVTLRTRAFSTGCYDDVTESIIIKPEPIPAFDPEVNDMLITEACAGIYITFDNNTTIYDTATQSYKTTQLTYLWDFNGGNPNTDEENPVRQFNDADTLAVTLTATSTDYTCFETDTVQVIIRPPPTGTFTITDQDICLYEEAEFNNGSEIEYGTLAFDWDFADGNTLTTADPASFTHGFAIPMMYEVKLTRTSNYGCVNLVSRNLTVHPTPVAAFMQFNVCDEKPMQFHNNTDIQSGEIESYEWDFGDSSPTTDDEEPMHTFPEFGTYNVTLTAISDFNCVGEITKPVEVYRNPFFNLGANVAACDGLYTLDPYAGADVYLPANTTFNWFNSDAESIGNTAGLTVDESDVYTVVLTTEAPQSCQSTINVPLYLFRPVDLGEDLAACDEVILDAEEGLPGEASRADNTTYQWTRNGIPVSNQQTLRITQSDDYMVTVTRHKGATSCASFDEIHVDIELPLTLTLPDKVIACDGETVILDAGVSADTYVWTNVNSGSVVGNAQTLSVTDPAYYRVEVSNGGCSASTVTEVVLSPAPAVSFSISPLSFCEDQDITFEDHSYTNVGNIVSREWDFDDNTTASNVTTVNKAFALGGDYSVTLVATTDNGCSNTFTHDITIKNLPHVDFNVTDACAETIVDINNTTSPANADFLWDFGDGTESTLADPAKSFGEAGTFNISLTATHDGCAATITRPVTINALPDLDFGNEITTCGASMVLDAYNPGASYRWFDPQNGNSTLATTQQYSIGSAGPVGLEITSVAGCTSSDMADVILNSPIAVDLGTNRSVCDEVILDAGYFPGASYSWSTSSADRMIDVTTSDTYIVDVLDQNGCNGQASVVITVNETPVLTIDGDQSFCSGDQLTLEPGTDDSFDYLWSNGATTSEITVTSGGTYTVEVTNLNCSATEDVLVTAHMTPQADFVAENVCEGSTITFDNTTTSSGLVSFVWDFGDGTTSAVVDPEKMFNSPDTYGVTLHAISEHNCQASITKNVINHHVPLASFTGANSCTGDAIGFSNESEYAGAGTLVYNWNFDDGTTADVIDASHAYGLAGSYWVNLTVTSSDGCSDNFLQQINIGETPSLNDWLTEQTTCNASVILDAGNAGSTYIWSDASTAQTLTVSASGNHQVAITSPDGCSVNAETTVTLYESTAPQLADAYEGCGSVDLQAGVTAASYLWSTGDQTDEIQVLATDEYWLMVINSDLCIGRDTTDVIVNAVPVFDLGADIEACDEEVLQLTAAPEEPVSYAWSTGETSQSINVLASGNYSATVTTDRGCEYTDNVTATFHALPVLVFDDEITACGSLLLDAENPGSTYVWSTGSAERSIDITESGSYAVRVTNTHFCSEEDTIAVSILTLPFVDLGPDVTVCYGNTVTLDAGTSANGYVWSDFSTERFFVAGTSGAYTATVIDDLGCAGVDTVNVTVQPPLGLDLGPDLLMCNNEGFSLTAGVDNVAYQWGSTTGFTSEENEVRPSETGTYWVRIEDIYRCTAVDTVTVALTTETIEASFLIPSVVDRGDIVHFAQLTDPEPVSALWRFGDGGISTSLNPTHSYSRVGEYIATLSVSNGVCTDTLSKTIVVRDARFPVEPTVTLPELIEIVNASQFPNPTDGAVNIELTLTSEAEVWIALVSLQGTIVDQHRKTMLEEVFEFDLTPQSNGIYLVRIIVRDRMKILKVLKVGGY